MPFSLIRKLFVVSVLYKMCIYYDIMLIYFYHVGRYYCAVKRKDSKRMPQFMSTLNTNLDLHVTVRRTSSQTEVRSPSVSIPFYPSFFVHQNEVVLSLQQREAELMVEGVEGVLRALQVSEEC